jgi:hypothetical protein
MKTEVSKHYIALQLILARTEIIFWGFSSFSLEDSLYSNFSLHCLLAGVEEIT